MNARISAARRGGASSRKAFTESMNSVSPRGKVADSALNQAVATGSSFSHQRRVMVSRPKRRSRTISGCAALSKTIWVGAFMSSEWE